MHDYHRGFADDAASVVVELWDAIPSFPSISLNESKTASEWPTARTCLFPFVSFPPPRSAVDAHGWRTQYHTVLVACETKKMSQEGHKWTDLVLAGKPEVLRTFFFGFRPLASMTAPSPVQIHMQLSACSSSQLSRQSTCFLCVSSEAMSLLSTNNCPLAVHCTVPPYHSSLQRPPPSHPISQAASASRGSRSIKTTAPWTAASGPWQQHPALAASRPCCTQPCPATATASRCRRASHART